MSLLHRNELSFTEMRSHSGQTECPYVVATGAYLKTAKPRGLWNLTYCEVAHSNNHVSSLAVFSWLR